MGRKRRTVPTALRRALWSRDRGCAFPGCHRRRYVDGHHIRHWADGGETSIDNTVLLCSHHHVLLHEGGFRMRRDASGTLRFQRPDGRVIPRGGYRLEDMVDDYLTDHGGSNGAGCASAEARASTEVRECRGVYRLGREVGVAHA